MNLQELKNRILARGMEKVAWGFNPFSSAVDAASTEADTIANNASPITRSDLARARAQRKKRLMAAKLKREQAANLKAKRQQAQNASMNRQVTDARRSRNKRITGTKLKKEQRANGTYSTPRTGLAKYVDPNSIVGLMANDSAYSNILRNGTDAVTQADMDAARPGVRRAQMGSYRTRMANKLQGEQAINQKAKRQQAQNVSMSKLLDAARMARKRRMMSANLQGEQATNKKYLADRSDTLNRSIGALHNKINQFNGPEATAYGELTNGLGSDDVKYNGMRPQAGELNAHKMLRALRSQRANTNRALNRY